MGSSDGETLRYNVVCEVCDRGSAELYGNPEEGHLIQSDSVQPALWLYRTVCLSIHVSRLYTTELLHALFLVSRIPFL